MTKSKLPFDLLSTDISKWLVSLEQQNSATSAITLNNAIKLLRNDKSSSSDLLTALIQLTPAILYTCNSIEKTFLTESKQQVYPVKVIRLCIQLLRNTALALARTNEQEGLSNDEQSLSIYMSLQIIGLCQRLTAMFHEPPSSSLWIETARLYKLALQNKINHQVINHKINDFKVQLSIESVIKRNILFNIFTSYKYLDKQIKELFVIASSLAEKLDLNDSTLQSSVIFYWDLNSNVPPNIINITQPFQQTSITINTKEVLVAMQMNSFSCSLDKEVILSLTNRLSGYHPIINAPIPSAPRISHLIFGYKSITEHLTKVNTLQKIEALGKQVAFDVPLGIQAKSEKYDKLNNPSMSAYSSKYKDLLLNAKPIKTHEVSNKNFFIASIGLIECNIGDMVLLCKQNLTNKVGIIRQVKAANTAKTLLILIEEIPGVASTQSKEQNFININTEKSHYLLFPSPCKHSNGSKVTSTSGANYNLEKLIDFSPFFSLYQANT